MARLTAPLMSFGARGQLGKSVVFFPWKGVNSARSYVKPANPKTTAQTTHRDLFSWVHDCYKYLDSNVTAAWKAYAAGKPVTGPNVFQQKNMLNLKGAANNDNMIFIPAVLGGPPNQGVAVAPGASSLAVTGTPPTIPTGWAITQMIAIAIPETTTFAETEPNISYTQVVATSPWTANFTSLTTGVTYVVGVGWEFTRSDGKTAYGGSTNSTGVPT